MEDHGQPAPEDCQHVCGDGDDGDEQEEIFP
jgi:hypothetical protein